MAVALLAAAVVMLLAGHARIPMWVAASAPVAVGLAGRWIDVDTAGDAIHSLDSWVIWVASRPM